MRSPILRALCTEIATSVKIVVLKPSPVALVHPSPRLLSLLRVFTRWSVRNVSVTPERNRLLHIHKQSPRCTAAPPCGFHDYTYFLELRNVSRSTRPYLDNPVQPYVYASITSNANMHRSLHYTGLCFYIFVRRIMFMCQQRRLIRRWSTKGLVMNPPMTEPLLPVCEKDTAPPKNSSGRACRLVFYNFLLLVGIALALLLIHLADKLNPHH
uniref:Transmembrane protein n=1 Tax=Steinernema glaseri TaxID=37863 RepID=A0A1I8A9D1_9BILA